MPISALRSRGGGAPSAASHSGARERRPVASTTSDAGSTPPSARRTPVTTGRAPSADVPVSPIAISPSCSATPGHARALSRSDHSNAARRQARRTTSSSSSRGGSRMPGGTSSASGISRTPAARSRSSTSGRCASSTCRRRARKACEWRNCGTPPRCQVVNASSGDGASVRSSRSRTTTRVKRRARRRAAASPAMPPPRTTACPLRSGGATDGSREATRGHAGRASPVCRAPASPRRRDGAVRPRVPGCAAVVLGCSAMPVNRTELTPLSFLARAAHVHAGRTAAVYGRRRFTYADLHARVARLAAALRGAGLRPGDRVAFVAPNVPAMLEAHFGVALAGGVLVAINTRLNADEIAYILEHSRARFLFVEAELAAGVRTVPTVERVITIDDPEFAPGAPRAFDGPEYEAFLDVAPDPTLVWAVP